MLFGLGVSCMPIGTLRHLQMFDTMTLSFVFHVMHDALILI